MGTVITLVLRWVDISLRSLSLHLFMVNFVLQFPSILYNTESQNSLWTRRDFSRMPTARFSTVWMCLEGDDGTLYRGGGGWFRAGALYRDPSPEQNDRHNWKHNLVATSLAGGNKCSLIYMCTEIVTGIITFLATVFSILIVELF